MTQPSQYLTDRTLAARYEVARSTIWRWLKEGQLPKPIKLAGSTRWRLADVEQWEAKQSEGA